MSIQGSGTFTIQGVTSGYGASYSRGIPSSLLGQYGLIGPEVLEKLFPHTRDLWVTRASTRYAILGPSRPDSVGRPNILTLDWVKDAQPFAWAATNPPSLLSMDWVKDGQPFVSNDDNGLAGFGWTIVAQTSLIPNIKSNVLAIEGITSLTARVKVNPFTFFIDAVATIGPLSTRTPKPCEFPGPIIILTSNLPFGVWQTNPDAIFTWSLVFVCPRVGDGPVQVDGYVWVMDKNPTTQPDFSSTRTFVPNAEIHLDQQAYGTGSWWFHVAAYDYVGVGPAAHYNVDYNHVPSGPGGQYMLIDGMDTLYQRPLVAYLPPNPHILSWNVALDIDPFDILSYEVQIGIVSDFTIDPSTHVSGIVLDVQNVPIGSMPIAETLAPGVYYWRIRATDGNQFSNWSPTGSFRINAPPLPPYDLAVFQTG